MGAVVRIVPAIFGCCQAGAYTNSFSACVCCYHGERPSRFSSPSNARRAHLDCFILDYIDYCTVMGWFERKDGCQYDDQSEDGKKTLEETKPLHVNTASNLAFEDEEID